MGTAYALAGERRIPRGVDLALPWGFALATVLAQIAYPLAEGDALRRLTIATVVLFALASTSHAWLVHGAGWAVRLVLVTAVGGFLAEVAGVMTGFPFGAYDYGSGLGPKLVGVPLIVPLAWTMMGYPALLAGRHLARRLAPFPAALLLTGWDMFLDPQMVAAGHWTWRNPAPDLPGVPGIPVTNFLGWLLVSLVMMTALHFLLPGRRPAADFLSDTLGQRATSTARVGATTWTLRRAARDGSCGQTRRDEALPALLLAWTWIGSTLGNLVFFGRPSVALVGALAMGIVVLPYLWSLWDGRP